MGLVDFDRKRIPDPLNREILTKGFELVADVDIVLFFAPFLFQELQGLSEDG